MIKIIPKMTKLMRNIINMFFERQILNWSIGESVNWSINLSVNR
jgi:hypothetical protein